MDFTIATIVSAAKRHLSIIGKRLYEKDGKNMFADITLSSVEDPILTQYINASAQDVEAFLKQLVTASTYSSTTITITIANTRGDSDFATRTQALAESFITLNTVGEYLSMVHPDISQKYLADARKRMEALVSYVFYKKPPTATGDPTAATATVS